MSRFFSEKYSSLDAYTPGEQPKDKKYVKLNTNESPFPPSQSVIDAVSGEACDLRLYSDPESYYLSEKCAEVYGVSRDMVLMTNGSDEILNFAFMAFCDEKKPIVFPDITYGFYPVFAELNRIPYQTIPLTEDFRVDYRDYVGIGKNIVIANPNAPTGIALPLSEIEEIVRSNSENVVIIDEAYVDFGGESAVGLTHKYDNLIVTMTFSKSRSMAGARLGFGIANPELIRDMNTIKYSTNPYNVNRMTSAAGIAALCDNSYYMDNCKIIEENREYTRDALIALGFSVLPSKANFLFAAHPEISGEKLYLRLKEEGILVRHFSKDRIKEYNRITVGTRGDMDALLEKIRIILRESKK
ncbi:MAG: histidinol-phosphate transaminase [Ruminococcaceae bacterium]|nr:histidinol-phosphate transaminase [Oscillospiraceae bacterium]